MENITFLYKYSNVWNETNRSSNREKMKYVKLLLLKHHVYHVHHALQGGLLFMTKLLKNKELLPDICQKLKISHFNIQNLNMICTRPITYCLSVLQGKEEIFF